MVDFTIAGSSVPYHTVINRHVFESLALNARIALHVRTLYGRDRTTSPRRSTRAVAARCVRPSNRSPGLRGAVDQRQPVTRGRRSGLRLGEPALGAAGAGTGRRRRRGDRRPGGRRQRRRTGGPGSSVRGLHDGLRRIGGRRSSPAGGGGSAGARRVRGCRSCSPAASNSASRRRVASGPASVTGWTPGDPAHGWNVVRRRPAAPCSRAWTPTPGSISCTPYAAQRWEAIPRRCSPGRRTTCRSWPPSRTARWRPHSFIRRRAATPGRFWRIGLRVLTLTKLILLPAVDVVDGGRCAWCRARPAARPTTARRWRRRRPGSVTARNGSTWWTSTRHSAGAATANCSPRWSVTRRGRGVVRRHPRRRLAQSGAGHRMRAVNIGTAALENPQWCAAAIAEYGDKVAVGLDVLIEDGSYRLRGRGWETDGGDLWRCWIALTEKAVRATSSPTSPRTAPSDRTKPRAPRGGRRTAQTRR